MLKDIKPCPSLYATVWRDGRQFVCVGWGRWGGGVITLYKTVTSSDPMGTIHSFVQEKEKNEGSRQLIQKFSFWYTERLTAIVEAVILG